MDECVNILGQRYGNRCRVIENQGDYAYIIRVKFNDGEEIQVQVSVPSKFLCSYFACFLI